MDLKKTKVVGRWARIGDDTGQTTTCTQRHNTTMQNGNTTKADDDTEIEDEEVRDAAVEGLVHESEWTGITRTQPRTTTNDNNEDTRTGTTITQYQQDTHTQSLPPHMHTQLHKAPHLQCIMHWFKRLPVLEAGGRIALQLD